MFDLSQNVFGNFQSIPPECQIVFVADMFSEDYPGGAEMTTEALIQSSPFSVCKVHSKDVTMDLLKMGVDKYWIFGNFAQLDKALIPSIVANMQYSILEYDYKYCRYRSPEKHAVVENRPCDCHEDIHGKIISTMFYQARSLWWMSEKQMDRYHKIFPFLADNNNTVLSSVFDDDFFARVKILRQLSENVDRKGWIIMGGTSWIKGTEDAKTWCESNNHEHEIVWNVKYDSLLEKLSRAEGLAFLPRGGDTCPRIVIEAKLLGCKLHINDNVEHAKELWFDTDDILDTESYLYMARQRFWEGIKHDMEYEPRISGYTTTYNCQKQGYPYVESIKSMLGFCDEVVVVDGGSDDGTWDTLQKWALDEPKLSIFQNCVDWNHKRFARFDGEQKAKARSLCTGDVCWQQDSDEIVHEDDHGKIKFLAKNFPAGVKILSLPVIEYWGGPDKTRMDIYPWKWRLSRNLPDITHGIPKGLRAGEGDDAFAKPGTDGCDYISRTTGEPIPHASFYTVDVDQFRRSGLVNEDHRKMYESWFNAMTSDLPSVHHYSWYDISRKIRTYRDYWSKHWQSLYDIVQEDLAENNMFFRKPWAEVTEQDIDNLAQEISATMGGWIFHRPLDVTTRTPHIVSAKGHPAVMKEWIQKHVKVGG